MNHDVIPLIDAMRARLPSGFDATLVLPALRSAQETRGYVSDSDIDTVVGALGVPRVQVEEVLSFYTQFRRAPIGRWHVQVCRNVSCSLRGAERLIDHVCRHLDVEPGATTADGRFTLATVECLGSCGTAPVVMINDSYHENASIETIDAVLDGLA